MQFEYIYLIPQVKYLTPRFSISNIRQFLADVCQKLADVRQCIKGNQIILIMNQVELDPFEFDKNYVIYDEDDVLIVAEALRVFLQVPDRSLCRLMKVMAEPEYKTNRLVTYGGNKKRMNVLTTKGIKHIFKHANLSHIINKGVVEQYFIELYDNHIISKIADFADSDLPTVSCMYLLRIKDNYFKFGETDDIKKRLKAHRTEFDFAEKINVFPCANKTISQKAESEFKEYCKTNGYLCQYPKKNDATKFHTEVFQYEGDISAINKIIEELIDQKRIIAAKADDDDRQYALRKHRIEMVDCGNQIADYDATKQLTMKLFETIHKLELKIDTMQTRISALENENGELKSTQPKVMVENITIKHQTNRPNRVLDIDMDELVAFVKRTFILVPNESIGRRKLAGHLSTTTYKGYYNEPESTREFHTILFTCIESVFGTSPKHPTNKDVIVNYKLNYLKIEEFIKDCCLVNEKCSENAESIKQAYLERCSMLNTVGFGIYEFPIEMKRLGYTSKVLKYGGKRYGGIYLRDNLVTKFICEECTLSDKNTCYSIIQFEKSFQGFCRSLNVNPNFGHDKASIKEILVENGFELVDFNNGCVSIRGIKINGAECDTRRKLLDKTRDPSKTTKKGRPQKQTTSQSLSI